MSGWLRSGLIGLAILSSTGPVLACFAEPWSVSDFPQSYVSTGDGALAAWFDDGSDRYPHGVLGDVIEPTSLGLITPLASPSCGVRIELDDAHVFEDLAPRLADLDGDGIAEIVVTRSHRSKGAQIAVYGWDGSERPPELVATTAYIGRSFRWLAIAGIADFNGDGRNDIAYVDRPHLAKVLRIVTKQGDDLVEIASQRGLSNHRIGEDFISGGVRDCGAGPEIVTADAGWSRVIATRLEGGSLKSRDLGPFEGPASFEAALRCP